MRDKKYAVARHFKGLITATLGRWTVTLSHIGSPPNMQNFTWPNTKTKKWSFLQMWTRNKPYSSYFFKAVDVGEITICLGQGDGDKHNIYSI